MCTAHCFWKTLFVANIQDYIKSTWQYFVGFQAVHRNTLQVQFSVQTLRQFTTLNFLSRFASKIQSYLPVGILRDIRFPVIYCCIYSVINPHHSKSENWLYCVIWCDNREMPHNHSTFFLQWMKPLCTRYSFVIVKIVWFS